MKFHIEKRRKQEFLLIFCFLFSGVFLFGQPYQIKHAGNSLQVYYPHKTPLEQLAIYVGKELPNPSDQIPPMLGSFRLEKDSLYFSPAFPFQRGRNYLLLKGEKQILSFYMSYRERDTITEITAIYPSADTVPANLLKMYIYFSAPMREGFSYQHVSLSNEAGDTLIRPFLELTPELWDQNSQRISLWFDPGRIKRELIPNRDFGTPLQAGQHYTLHISSSWKDREGRMIKSDESKSFYTKGSDRMLPIPESWSIRIPNAHSREALEVNFHEPMDQSLALAACSVWKKDQEINGKSELLAHEKIWTFSPTQSWKSGRYRLEIQSRLEDLAGNNLNRLFDRDISNDATPSPEKKIYQLEFRVK